MKEQGGTSKTAWIIGGSVIVVAAGLGAFIISLLSSDLGPQKKNNVSTVNLMKPPPPPAIKEKPPELQPEIKREKKVREEIVDAGPDKSRANDKPDEKPAAKQLGLDAEGTAGSDSFGLVGNRGGAELIGGGEGAGGGSSKYAKFNWYTQALQDEVDRLVRKRLVEKRGIAKNKMQTLVKISLDPRGRITDCRIVGSSGDRNVDGLVEDVLKTTTISQPPPEGMPKRMTIRVVSQG